MTKFTKLITSNYKLLPVFMSLFISACGGTSANGVGGTGITQGRVTGFGSMFVNGVKFDTDNATFIRDGISSKKQEDFNTGEIVTIKGTVNEGRKTGVATEVVFSDILEGTITATPSANTVEILGQKITTNNLTVFHGFNRLNELSIGNVVEVSGFNVKNNITASSIQLINTSFIEGSNSEVEGDISSLNRGSLSFEINGLVIDYSNAIFSGTAENAINEGDYLIVTSNHDIENNILKADRIESINNTLLANTYYEIEGFVTDFDSAMSFVIDDENAVISNADTVFTNGTANDIKLDQLVLVIGTTNAQGVLVTEEIRIIDSANTLSIEANIESIDLTNNSIVVLGQTIEVDSFTLISDETTEDFAEFSLNEFAVGDSVFIDISVIDGDYFANRLSKIIPISIEFVIGTVGELDTNLNQFTIAKLNISTDANTEFLNQDGDAMTASMFFSLIEEGISEVGLETNYVANQTIIATEIILFENE